MQNLLPSASSALSPRLFRSIAIVVILLAATLVMAASVLWLTSRSLGAVVLIVVEALTLASAPTAWSSTSPASPTSTPPSPTA